MTRRNFIYLFLAMAAAVATCACTDDSLIDTDPYRKPGNTIAFEVSSGRPSGENADASRSAAAVDDEDDGLAPVVYTAGNDTLYLHRYVAAESERATGREATVSRSTPVNTATDFAGVCKDGGFMVKAMFTADDSEYFPLSKAVELAGETGGDVWHLTNPSRYWPDDRELRFQAIAPGSALDLFEKLTLTSAGIKFDYTVPVSTDSPRRDAESQPDIMVATTVCSHTDGTIDCDKAPLNFRHALAAIKFAVRDVTTGEIADISIKGVAGSGSCLFTMADGFTWSNLGETADYTQVFNYKTTDVYPAEAPVTPIDMPEKTFMLIPQEIPDDAILEITLVSGGKNKTLSGKLKTVDIPLWEAGKEYVYTISTSSENWTYVFDVIGSDQEKNEAEPAEGKFSDANGIIEINPTVTQGSYYKVRSYRYRTNKPSIIEPVEWSATSTDGKNSIPSTLSAEYADLMEPIAYDEWLPGVTIRDDGSIDLTKYDVVFAPQDFATDWPGDWELRKNAEKGSKDSPFDLSTLNGLRDVSTANCYVVNSSGYYKFPLVYGNALTGGNPNTQAYIPDMSNGAPASFNGYSVLQNFVDYNGNAIGSPYISGVASAALVWEDAFNMIGEVYLSDDGKDIVFQVKKNNIQQGNAVIAAYDAAGAVMWSWHIWATEYWVDDNGGLGVGDVECDSWDSGYGPFYFAPRNLGWCDAKNFWYLERTGNMVFTQKYSNKEGVLKIKQRPQEITYWEGNNSYYQFGRKDPFVGFLNHTSDVKYNFGEIKYSMEKQPTSIKESIRKPQVLFVGADASEDGTDSPSNDWLNTKYSNLWNNKIMTPGWMVDGQPHPEQAYSYTGIKTVYDPSPVGYRVPPIAAFKIFVNGEAELKTYVRTDFEFLNGTKTHKATETVTKTYGSVTKNYTWVFNEFTVYGKKNKQGLPLTLNATGHRWYTVPTERLPFSPGDNFNGQYVYLWGNQGTFRNDRSAYSLAIGEDAPSQYVFQSFFIGRRSMARPIRCVRE